MRLRYRAWQMGGLSRQTIHYILAAIMDMQRNSRGWIHTDKGTKELFCIGLMFRIIIKIRYKWPWTDSVLCYINTWWIVLISLGNDYVGICTLCTLRFLWLFSEWYCKCHTRFNLGCVLLTPISEKKSDLGNTTIVYCTKQLSEWIQSPQHCLSYKKSFFHVLLYSYFSVSIRKCGQEKYKNRGQDFCNSITQSVLSTRF